MIDWTKYEEVKRLYDSGMKFRAIGKELGIRPKYIKGMLEFIEYRDKCIADGEEIPTYIPRWAASEDRPKKPKAPHWFDGLKKTTAYQLQKRGFKNREDCMIFAADDLIMRRGSVCLSGWENDLDYWKWSKNKIGLTIVNEVRAWLGIDPYVPATRVASDAELDRARRLLEQHGWRVEPPTT